MIWLLRRCFLYLLLVIVGNIIMASTILAESVETIFITAEIDSSNFPDLNLEIRTFDGNNDVPPKLTNEDIAVYENGRLVHNFELSDPIDGPVNVIFVIDLGQASNFRGGMADAVRDSMLHFSEDYFRDGIDTVGIIAREVVDGYEESVTILEPTQSAVAFINSVNNLNLQPTGRTEGLLGVETALNQIARLGEPGYAGSAIIFISRLVEWPQQSVADREAHSLAVNSFRQFTKLYSLHTDVNYGEPLQTLAFQSGGEYVQLLAGQDNSDNLNPIYQSIMTSGISYSLNYRSNIGDSGPRTVAVTASGVPAERVTNSQTYNVSLKPAEIKIQTPEDDALFTRTASRLDDDSWDYDLDQISITANLTSWPDDIEREISQVEFFANDVSQQTVSNPAGDSFNFNLDISQFETPEAFTIYVKIIDELGIEAISEPFTLNIAIDRPEEVTTIVLPTQTPLPPPTPIMINENPCVANSTSTNCIQHRVIIYAPWGIVVILSIILLFYRQKLVMVAGVAGGVVRDRVGGFRKTILGGAESQNKIQIPLAKLHVLIAKPNLHGEEIKIFNDKTTIGRNPKLCDIQLYDTDDISSVSGQHCTIYHDSGAFLISDDNSTNGTVLNGDALRPNTPYKINHGDEIILGNLYRRGAKLRFEILTPTQANLVKRPHDNNVTLVDMEPAIKEEGETRLETILDFDYEENKVFIGQDENISGAEEEQNDEWLSQLE